MHKWARLAIVALIAYAVVIVLWGQRSWTDTQKLVTPKKVDPMYVTYECEAVFSGGAHAVLQGDQSLKYPLSSTPCGDQRQRLALGVADLAIAGAGIAGIVAVERRRGRRPQPVSV